MWALVDAGLVTMTELSQDTLTIDDFFDAFEYLHAKAQRESEVMAEARAGRR